jgi:cellobiose phosphorylase
LIEALSYQYESGLALRGWNPPDIKPYSDSALWLVFTLIQYLKETLDFAILDEKVAFYDKGNDTVLFHIQKALDFLEEHKGSHGLCLIKFGDWNDSLTAVGKNGYGESVWLSQAYAEALREMEELACHLGNKQSSQEYNFRYHKMKEAINTEAWDGEWYVRCFDDNGNGIGTKDCIEGKIFSETQAWAMISGISDQDRTKKIISSCEKYLSTDQGFKLLSPAFTKFDPRVGRISSLVPGICENGTIYTHTNIWMILGFIKMGYPEKAFEYFKKITSGYITDENDRKNLSPPYIYANCYFGPDHINSSFQMEYTWITGSVAWIYHVLNSYILGIRAEYKGLIIDPCIPKEWKEYEVIREFRGSIYKISFINHSHLNKGNISLVVDGKMIEGNCIPDFKDGQQHEVIVHITE